MKRILVMATAAALLTACDEDDDNGTGGTHNGGSNATTEGWSITFEGGEDVFDLPDLEGDTLSTGKAGQNLQINAFAEIEDRGDIIVTLVVGEALEVKDYQPQLFGVSFSDTEFDCAGAGENVTVSVTGLEPATGTWSGKLNCQDGPDNMFETTIDGQFTAGREL